MRMTRPLTVRAKAGYVSLLLFAGSVLLNVAPVEARVVHRPLHHIAAVTADPVTVPFGVQYFGLAAELAPGTLFPAAPYGEVRFRHGNKWAPWQPLGEDGAQGENQFTAALISVSNADAYQVRGLPSSLRAARAAALNLTDGPVVTTRTTPGVAAGAAASCASRADWNADESITAWTKGTDTMTFSPDQVVTVHHTAGSNDPTQSYPNTVLAIEQYHVLTNHWSDIGYQYLIDPNGVVYEGRNSGHTSRSCISSTGDGSDFAHRTADDAVVTGAHTGGYNTGNLGIAMIGCFDSTSTTCSPGAFGPGDTTATPAAMAALEQLLARLATRHGLNPTGTVTYTNPTNTKAGVPAFTGHRDWEATACPGDNVYAQLPNLRTKVAGDMAPVNVQATTTTATAHLTWSAGASWPSAPRATRFRVRRGDVVVADTSALVFDDSGLASGTSYTYSVSALAADGTQSSPWVATTATTAPATAPASDFSLAISPANGSMGAGGSTTPVVTTTGIGSPSSVNLTATVQPGGSPVTAVLGASSVSSGGSTTLQVSSTFAAAGSYTVNVTGTSASATHSATYSLTVTNASPSAAITSAGCSGARCTFIGSARDPEGGTTVLQWQTPSGTPSSTGNYSSASTTYSGAGTYTVSLTASDPAGFTGTASAHVTCSWIGKGKNRSLGCTATTP